jgi:raffinose/stachyose/melibiose transport system substrate-binding protein
MRKLVIVSVLLVLVLSLAVVHAQDKVEIVMGSWRTEDIEAWDNILAVFEAANPDIDVKFEPSLNTNYDATVTSAVDAGTGPDLITCRPFDITLQWYQKGGLVDIKDIEGLSHFSDVAKGAWSTDDKSATYCVPMASVIHGFIYNQDIFDQVGVEVPKTESEFFAVLDKIKAAGIVPLDITTKDAWTTATMGFNNMWPNFAGGEKARLGVIDGTMKLTDPGFVAALATVARWKDYLPEGHESIGYADAQQLFPLGGAAIYPSGSWEIPLFESMADFKMGAFKPYTPDGATECSISDHVDIAVGMNAKGAHQAEARTFLEWLTTADFAQAYSDNQPGFFSLSDHPVEIKDPLAAEFVSWRQECGSTIRLFDQFLSRGEPAGNDLMDNNVYLMVQGSVTPEEVAKTIQDGLDQWYVPAAEATPSS